MTTPEKLRALADWFEAHPEVPQSVSYSGVWAHTCVTDTEVFKHIGSFKKEMDDNYFYAHLMVGDVNLRLMCPRTQVCTPKVVGKKRVAEVVIPAIPERLIPEHEEDIIEWDCSSVLAPEQDEVEA